MRSKAVCPRCKRWNELEKQIKGTGHRRPLQVLRKYRPQAGYPLLEKRLRVLRIEDRQGIQLYETRQPVQPPATAGAAPGNALRKPLGGGRQLPFGICRVVRRHGSGGTREEPSSPNPGGKIDAIPLPPASSPVGVSAAQLQRKPGESPEEHIARITALLDAAAAAMAIAAMERRRRMEEQKRRAKMKI